MQETYSCMEKTLMRHRAKCLSSPPLPAVRIHFILMSKNLEDFDEEQKLSLEKAVNAAS